MANILEPEKKAAEIIAEKAANLSTAQQIRVLGVIEGISLAATVDKAAESNKTA